MGVIDMGDSAGVAFSSGQAISQLISIVLLLVFIIFVIVIVFEIRKFRKKLKALEERLNNIENRSVD
jgi:preprotein translocase subunit YajC